MLDFWHRSLVWMNRMNDIDILQQELEKEKKAREEAERQLKEKSIVLSQAQDQLQKAYEDILVRVKIFEQGISSTKGLLETEIKRRQTTEALYQTIVNTAIDAIITISNDGVIETVNNATLDIFGYEREEIIGKNVSILMNPPESLNHQEYIKNYLATHQSKTIGTGREVVGKHKDGSKISLHIAVSEVKLGEHLFFTGILRDIRDIKSTERKLEESRKQERQIAWEIQRNLLFGKVPQLLPDIHICAFSVPSKEISGDFYDFIRHNDHCFDIVIGDVMGKGVPAALIGSAVKSQILRSIAQLSIENRCCDIPSVSEIITRLSEGIYKDMLNLERFATLCYARIDLEKRKAVFVDCGHTKTMCYRHASHQCDLVFGDNLPLGIIASDQYKETAVPFSPGDVFFFYTDGLTESTNTEQEMYGEERLEKYILQHYDLPVDLFLEHLNDELHTYTGSNLLFDDFSCIALKIGPSEEHPNPFFSSREFLGTTSELYKIRNFISNQCQDFVSSLEAEVLDQILLSVQEASTNIIKYSYKNQKDKSFIVKVEVIEKFLIITLRYTGESFDPTCVPPPQLDGSKEHGFGIYIINHLMDSVRYYTDENGFQCIRLMKRWQ